ncbi:MAG: hypothetical protein JWM92_273, partial [Candidatus Nomurabacteria bacterium]|nr:hypothetical protein [Candidatus Nomurabacteria bacterium]
MSLPQTSNNFLRKKIAALIVGSMFVFCMVGIFSPIPVYALTLSPARIEINGDAGTTVGGEFTLINEQGTTQTFYASYENFSAQGETGAPAFSAEQSGLDTWLGVIPTQVTLTPGQVAKIPYTIAIPKGTEPGGYFAVIFWSNTPPSSESNQVSIGAKVGLLVLLRVNGTVTESAGITQFDRNGH